MNLLAAEWTEIYKTTGKHHYKMATRWAARLVPDKRPWIGRKFGEVNNYVTQLLLGHEYFRKYQHKIDKTAPLTVFTKKAK